MICCCQYFLTVAVIPKSLQREKLKEEPRENASYLSYQSTVSSVKKSKVKGVINLNSDSHRSVNSTSLCADPLIMGVVEMCN